MNEPVGLLLPGRVGLVVRLTGRPGSRAAVLDAIHRYVDRLDEEPGTEAFVVSVDPTDGDVVWLYEWFRDEAAHDAHRASAPFADLMEHLPDLLAQPPGILRMDPLRVRLAPALVALSRDGGV